MFKSLLRPLGFAGCLLAGAVAMYFFKDKVKEQVDKVTGK